MILGYLAVVMVMVNMGNSMERLTLYGNPYSGFYLSVHVGNPPVLVSVTSSLNHVITWS